MKRRDSASPGGEQRMSRRSTLKQAGAGGALAVAAGAAPFAHSSRAAQGEADSAEVEELVRAVVAAINAGDADAFDEWVAEDIVGHAPVPLPGAGKGLAGAKENLAALRAGLPDVELTIEDVVAAGDTVAVRGVMRGTHTGEFLGVPATGAALELPGVCVARVVDGKAVEYWSHFDQLAALEQAGFFSLDDVAAGD